MVRDGPAACLRKGIMASGHTEWAGQGEWAVWSAQRPCSCPGSQGGQAGISCSVTEEERWTP